jgi:hypothetical protein
MGLAEKLANLVKVKVIKRREDTRTSLYGEPVQRDADGSEYFIIPAHMAEYTKQVHVGYEVGEEFIPEDVDKDTLTKIQKDAVKEVQQKLQKR